MSFNKNINNRLITKIKLTDKFKIVDKIRRTNLKIRTAKIKQNKK